VIELTVNGTTHRFEGDPETPLLWYLRDELGLVGTRFGCGAALCGCCTVHIRDQAARSCCITIGDVEGRPIKTIEGLGAAEPHALQKAWIELDVPQCGYCQSGQLMQAAALLLANPDPSDRDIDEAMSGNICGCGTYPKIRSAIKNAARELAGREDRSEVEPSAGRTMR
jgi:isoquinoline 1-oxidoreductase alpha subunit